MFRFYSEPGRATEVCVYEALAPPVKIQAALPLTWGEAGSDAGGGMKLKDAYSLEGKL